MLNLVPGGFDLLLASKGVSVALFGGPGCAACRALEPMLAAVCAEQGVDLYHVNAEAEDHLPLVARLGIRARPTVLVVRGGEVAERLVGKLARGVYVEAVRGGVG